MYSNIHSSRPATSTPPNEWKKIWKIKVIPRVRMFLWRLCACAIPTKVNLYRRGFKVDPICSLCGEDPESVDHLFMNCRVIHKVWYTSSLRIDMRQEPHENFRDLLWQRILDYPNEYVELLATTIWEIWKGRNNACFDNHQFDAVGVNHRALSQWNNLRETRHRCALTEETQITVTGWKKPAQGKMKLNCDVAIGKNGIIGMGFVLRDDHGRVMLAGNRKMNAEGTSTLLEAMAIRYGVQTVKQYHLQANTVEGDNKTCMEGLNGTNRADLYCDVIFKDIKELAQGVDCNTFIFAPRSENEAAHVAAHGMEFLSYHHCPGHIRKQIEKDVTE